MIAHFETLNGLIKTDLSKAVDLSIFIQNGKNNVNAFHIPDPRFAAIEIGSYVGSVAQGAGANCEVLTFCAHGNGTHTECVGHITRERISVNQCLKSFWFNALVISVEPFRMINDDTIILKEHLEATLKGSKAQALIIRTLPNSDSKKTQVYSGTNPTYLHWNAAKYIREYGIQHLLLDLPSLDREEDGGDMLAHKAFWGYPEEVDRVRTITELIYVPDFVRDGAYLLNLQVAPLETDAAPSKPLLYPIL